MFLEDELEYVRLKRNDNIMGWLAIVFVAALVFMFAGIMNSASATGSHSGPAHRAEMSVAAPLQAGAAAAANTIDKTMIVIALKDAPVAAPAAMQAASTTTADDQTPLVSIPEDNAGVAHASIATLADHDIKTGALLLSLALIGGSFVMLTFGGPRGGKREDEDMIDAI
ncbi:hypothetical protein ABID16_000319 [Rhizobium aquaticum]|uniref:Uncharacterized protein n=1 Tax=Rhizobium aquaticum TaxID=1549636 RepID=A0ABV2IU43_9HYPH